MLRYCRVEHKSYPVDRVYDLQFFVNTLYSNGVYILDCRSVKMTVNESADVNHLNCCRSLHCFV